SHSFLSSIFDNPYNIVPIELVSTNYFGKDFNPNVGIWGDAYLNFGFLGVFLFSLILGIVLILFDSISDKSITLLSMSIIVIPSMSLVNSALFTSLLTHGILFAIVLT